MSFTANDRWRDMTLPQHVLNAVKIEGADTIPTEKAADVKEGVEDGCHHLQGMENGEMETTAATGHPLWSSEPLCSKEESSGRNLSDSHLPCGEDGRPSPHSRDQNEDAVFARCEQAEAAEIGTAGIIDAQEPAERFSLVVVEDSMREKSHSGLGPVEDGENSEGEVTPEVSSGTSGEDHRLSERPIDEDQDPTALQIIPVPELALCIAEEISPASQSATPQDFTSCGTFPTEVRVCKQEEFPLESDMDSRLSLPPQSSGLDTFSGKFMALNMACGHLIRYNRPRTWKNIQLLSSGSQHTLSLEDIETLALYFPQMVTLEEVDGSEGKDTIVQLYDPFDPKVALETDPKRDLDLEARRAVERRQKSFNLFLLQFNERLRSSQCPQSQEATTQTARRHEDFAAKQMAADGANCETGPVILALPAPQLNANPSPLPPRVRVQAPSRPPQSSSSVLANVQRLMQRNHKHVYHSTVHHEAQNSGQQAPCQAQETTEFAGGFDDRRGPVLQIQPHPSWQSDSLRRTTVYHNAPSHEIVQAPVSTLVQTVQPCNPASLGTNHGPPSLIHTQFIPVPVQSSPAQAQTLSSQQGQSGSNRMTEIYPHVGILFHMEPQASEVQSAPSRGSPSHHRPSFLGGPPHYMQAAAGHVPQEDVGPPAKTRHWATSPSSSHGTPPFARNVSHWSQTAAQMTPGVVPITTQHSQTMLQRNPQRIPQTMVQMTASASHQGPPLAIPPQLTSKDAHRFRNSSQVHFDEHHSQSAARTIPQTAPTEHQSQKTAQTTPLVSSGKHHSETTARTGSPASPIDYHNWIPSPVSLDKHHSQTTARGPVHGNGNHRVQMTSFPSPDMMSIPRNNARHRDGTIWEFWQVALLIQAKKIEVERLRSCSAQSPVETIAERWRNVELWLKHRTVEDKDASACREKWESLLDDYRDIDRWRLKFPAWPYHLLSPFQKKIADLPPTFASDLVDLMDTFVKSIDETPPETQRKFIEVSSSLVDHTSDQTFLNEPSTEDCDRGASSGVEAAGSGSERSEDEATPSSHSDGGNVVRDGEASGGITGGTNVSDKSENDVISPNQNDGTNLFRDMQASGGTTAARNEPIRNEDEVIPEGLGNEADLVPASAVREAPSQRVSLEGAIDRLAMSFCELHKNRDQRLERRLALKEQELQLKRSKRKLAEQRMVDQRLERPEDGSSDRFMALEEQRLQVKKSKLQLEQRREEMDIEDHRITMGAFCTLAAAFRKLADQMEKSP